MFRFIISFLFPILWLFALFFSLFMILSHPSILLVYSCRILRRRCGSSGHAADTAPTNTLAPVNCRSDTHKNFLHRGLKILTRKHIENYISSPSSSCAKFNSVEKDRILNMITDCIRIVLKMLPIHCRSKLRVLFGSQYLNWCCLCYYFC